MRPYETALKAEQLRKSYMAAARSTPALCQWPETSVPRAFEGL